ncbi:MAG: TonB-dependent receptor [Acidobacteria bacterium]|nr:TonB-dependent receptor [Acidobacteriota bacterium]
MAVQLHALLYSRASAKHTPSRLAFSLFGLFLIAEIAGTPCQASIRAMGQGSGQRGRVEGTVLDPRNHVIAGARLTLTPALGGSSRSALTTADRFAFEGLPLGTYSLRAEAMGFETATLAVDLSKEQAAAVAIRLEPKHFGQEITVTAARTERLLGDVAASVSVLGRKDIEQSAGLVADDVLRQIPAFSLFRRTSSLAAHPTAQGVSLRGVGPSGVSRTLVLLDDMPFNDPFGGWVYWTRIPLTSVDRMEVVEGAASTLYGNYAIGGVISILTKRPERRTLVLSPQYGSRGTAKFDFFASDVWKQFGAGVEGSIFHTDGYRVVPENVRGLVDTKADEDYRNFNVRMEFNPSPRWNAFLKGGYFGEGRNNGKILEHNNTQWKFLGGGLRFRTPDNSDWQVLWFSHFQTFDSTFLGVTNNRNTGRLTLTQRVPTDGLGGSVQWSKRIRRSHFLIAGADGRSIDGESQENVFDASGQSVVRLRVAGGSQRTAGAFVQDIITPIPRLQLTVGARLDYWKNYDASQRETILSAGQRILTRFTDKRNSVGSPRLAALYHLADGLSVWGDLSSGFRAPTLNELYRPFRVGNVLTLANDQLGPERLFGSQAGMNYAPRKNMVLRITGFWNRFRDPVSNVTLSSAPSQITRQRRNLGEARIWGVQSYIEYQFSPQWNIAGAYIFDAAEVTSFPADRQLVGRILPQVPKHRTSVQIAYTNPRYLNFAVFGQFVDRQFDDDLNRFSLPGYFVADFSISRPIGESFEVFLAGQNLLNRRYLVGTNPTTLGSPMIIHAGFRLRLTGR